MEDIFLNIQLSSIVLFNKFLDDFPDIAPVDQEYTDNPTYRRRNPSDSRITKEELNASDIRDLYNKIRCLTDPYPNACIEDSDGKKLFISGVRFSDD